MPNTEIAPSWQAAPHGITLPSNSTPRPVDPQPLEADAVAWRCAECDQEMVVARSWFATLDVEDGQIVKTTPRRPLAPDTPVFCSADCALDWIVENADRVARFFGLQVGAVVEDAEGYGQIEEAHLWKA